jgi:hypothetical protein
MALMLRRSKLTVTSDMAGEDSKKLEDTDERELTRLAAAALDQLDEVTPADEEKERLLSEIDKVMRESATGVGGVEELRHRVSVLLDQHGHHVMDSHSKQFAERFARLDRESHLSSGKVWIPRTALPSWLWTDRRYSLEWKNLSAPSGLTQSETASADNGTVYVASVATAAIASGWAGAAVGILARPTHPIGRLTFRPDVHYSWDYWSEVESTRNFGHAQVFGKVEFLIQRWDPVSRKWDAVYPARVTELFSTWNTAQGGSKTYDGGSGYVPPSTDPGIMFIATSGELYALWVIAKISIDKVDRPSDAGVARNTVHARGIT